MRLGCISDAHGNPYGLAACREELIRRGAERIYFLGDAVGYWPHGAAVLEELARRDIPCLQGNHEAMLLGRLDIPAAKEDLYRLKPLAAVLPGEARRRIARGWPETMVVESDGLKILMVHGRPADHITGYLYESSELMAGEGSGFGMVIMGHTHRPFIRREKGILWVNAGSCGLPRDRRDAASCAMVDTVTGQASIVRVPLDAAGLVASCRPGSVSPRLIEYAT